MKLGIGAKAGLAGGIIIGGIYALSFILFYAALSLGEQGLTGTGIDVIGVIAIYIFGFLYVMGYVFIGGYYQFFVTSEIYFVILLVGVGFILGGVFQEIYNFLPTNTPLKKGLVYSAGIWSILGVLALFLPFVGEEFGYKIKNFPLHIPTIIGWLLYGLLLGRL
jgi:hypothetical protein